MLLKAWKSSRDDCKTFLPKAGTVSLQRVYRSGFFEKFQPFRRASSISVGSGEKHIFCLCNTKTFV
jgi:hypothetical protein